MRSFADRRTRVIVAAMAAWLSVSGAAFAQTAKARYENAVAQDEKLRVLLTNTTETTPPAGLMSAVVRITASFESLVRRFPTSGYADNALWNAATLAEAAYQKFNRTEDRDRAVRMYQWLVNEYPTSTLVARANANLDALAKPAAPTPPPTPPSPAPTPTAIAETIAPPVVPAQERAILTNIQRIVLPEIVRVTIELDREVTYREERLSGPQRLFFDLKNAQAVPELKDKVISYPSEIVSKIRVGRHPDNTVRVVLDFEDVTKYSVFTLYSPFRLVVDAERKIAGATSAAGAPDAPPPATPSVLAEIPKLAPAPPPPLPAPLPAAAPPPDAPPVALAPIAATPLTPAANAAGGFSIARQLGLSVSRIVIDPGHGGHDPGVLGRGLNEATLVLDVALRLEKLLQKETGVEVVLTRRTDVYVPLEERTEIANRHSADLFLSIHANASRNADAKGIEVFYLSFASSPEAEAVAARENSASAQVMHQLPDLIKAITLNNKLDESRDLANMVQEALVSNLRKTNKEIRSRGVKKAPFVVLIGAQMPSVLAEISFVSNRQELALLKTAAYKQKIAESLYNAVMKYRRSLKNQTVVALPER